MQLAVRVTPRGGRDAIEGWVRDDAARLLLKVRVAAAAADGQANAAVLALLAKALGRPKSALTLLAGHTARIKRIEVDGIDADALARAFGDPPPWPVASALHGFHARSPWAAMSRPSSSTSSRARRPTSRLTTKASTRVAIADQAMVAPTPITCVTAWPAMSTPAA